MADKNEYQRGYSAGRKYNVARIKELEQQLATNPETRRERVYLKCLELALAHCSDWTVGGKPIKNSQGYCDLAKIFADNSIGKIEP